MAGTFVHESSYVDDGVIIGEGTKVWYFCHIESGAHIGRNCQLGQNVYIGKNVRIGDGCKIQNNVSIYSGVELGDYVFCGPSCVFTNDLTPRAKFPKGPAGWLATRVGEGATIGANATIVCGNDIGAWSMVAAGAVVTKDVPPHTLVRGNPAGRGVPICRCGALLRGAMRCERCGRAYRLASAHGLGLVIDDELECVKEDSGSYLYGLASENV